MGKHRQYSESDLKEAIAQIKSKRLSTWKAAKEFHIPKVTLQNYLKKGIDGFMKRGREYRMSSDDEAALERWLFLGTISYIKNNYCIEMYNHVQ